jgi:N-methylhydantoinase A
VPRELRGEVRERLLAGGAVLEKLRAEDVEAALGTLASAAGEPVEAVAVCFLYSVLDPAHERLAGAVIADRWPQAYVSLSSDVSPEFREYERLSTTVLNAYLGPLIRRYVERFDGEVRRLGVPAAPHINQSNGGIISAAAATRHPVRTLLSGPSAGVMGAAWVASQAGADAVITFDMGGTSTDVARVEGGRPVIATERTIAGYPVRIPTLSIETVGAGGGSVGWVDSGGALKVGPESAGASPGPACYGRGGTRPTVTDANVVLGRLSATELLDGVMALSAGLATQAMERLARELGTSAVDAARGMLAVVQTNMLGAIRVVSVRRGYDPRGHTMVAFGGAGPLHAAALARDLGIGRVLVPPAPGILCALGLLVEPLRLDLVRTRVQLLQPGSVDAPRRSPAAGPTDAAMPPAGVGDGVERAFAALEAEAAAWLAREGVPAGRRRIVRAFDMRYLGQNFELTVPEPAGARGGLDAARRAFFREHERVYGYFTEDEPVQIVNVRVTAIGEPDPLVLQALARAATSDPKAACAGERPAYFDETGGFVPTPLYRRERLLAGHVIAGPAIVDQMDATTVILPGQVATVDERANLVIDTGPA